MMFIILLLSIYGCGTEKTNNSFQDNNESSIFSMKQRNTTDQIISIFENNTPIIQYDYAKNLSDGRGITAGRAGFTSATADMLEVIKRYTAIVPNNSLSTYLSRLEELATNEGDSVIGLEGLENSWKECSNDAIFRNVQDEILNEWYFFPAVKQARLLGVKLPLTLLNLYDAIIQHGEGADLDGLPNIINQTTLRVGGTIKDGIDEKVWLNEFMNVRRAVLENPNNKNTEEEWSESVNRVDTLMKLYNNDKFYLELPIVIDTWDTVYTL